MLHGNTHIHERQGTEYVMARKTTQYVIEVGFDDEQMTELEADLVFRERLRDALSGVFATHIGRVQ